ncbi:NADPH-dependent thioredoxin reductase 3 [Zea mays]|uniref:NADPH-dependent thioredoxin reductase 3 n=1 Tax=Zea mays TaxID=4577 RepID=A0A1D6ILV1_MAIZE|nr:NADPH-dependent thioredoxin reductase 3 [Zea mays]
MSTSASTPGRGHRIWIRAHAHPDVWWLRSSPSPSQREIPSSNIALHSAHYARNLQKCEHCGNIVPRKLVDQHYDENHAPASLFPNSKLLLDAVNS